VKINCNYRPEKQDPYRTRITVGGDKMIFKGEKAVQQNDLEEYKFIFFMLEWIPKDFIQEYGLEDIEKTSNSPQTVWL